MKTKKKNFIYLYFLKCPHYSGELLPNFTVELLLLEDEEEPGTQPSHLSGSNTDFQFSNTSHPAMSLCSIKTRSTCTFIKFFPNIALSIPEWFSGPGQSVRMPEEPRGLP